MTEDKNNSVEHHIDQLWAGQKDLGAEVSEIKEGMSGLVAEFRAFRTQVAESIRPKEFPWVGVVSLFLMFAVASASLVASHLLPIRETNRRQDESIAVILKDHIDYLKDLGDRQYEAGVRDGRINALEGLVDDLKNRMHTEEQERAASSADRRAIHRQLDAVDHGGSRKWIGVNTQ